MKIFSSFFYVTILSLSFATNLIAQTHKGKMDTDGILSAGEIRNPRINYGAQTHRGELDTDGILSPGEIRNPRIDYEARGYYGGAKYPSRPEYGRPNYDPNYDWKNHRGSDRHNNHNYQSQYNNSSYGNSSFTDVIGDGVRSGRISRQEEAQLVALSRGISRREEWYARDGGISWYERRDLDSRLADFHDTLNHELNDGERRR